MTKIKLEFIPDLDMYIFFEKCTRGRISHVSNRYSKAKNKYLKFYDTKRESKNNIYLDANKLYGYVMSKIIPTSGFERIDPKEFDLNKHTVKRPKRCVLEGNL